MKTFEVGDLICGLPEASEHYYYTNADMTSAQVLKVRDQSMDIKLISHDKYKGLNYDIFTVKNDPKLFRLLARKSKRSRTKTWDDKSGYNIHITRKPGSDTVEASIRMGGSVFTGSAKCSKDDEFNIAEGARIAIERAVKEMRDEPARTITVSVNTHGVKVGDFVVMKESHYGLNPGDIAEVVGLGRNNFIYVATIRDSIFSGTECVTDKSKLVQPYGYTNAYSVLARQPVRAKESGRK